jgi:hypothetical protein
MGEMSGLSKIEVLVLQLENKIKNTEKAQQYLKNFNPNDLMVLFDKSSQQIVMDELPELLRKARDALSKGKYILDVLFDYEHIEKAAGNELCAGVAEQVKRKCAEYRNMVGKIKEEIDKYRKSEQDKKEKQKRICRTRVYKVAALLQASLGRMNFVDEIKPIVCLLSDEASNMQTFTALAKIKYETETQLYEALRQRAVQKTKTRTARFEL